MGRTMDGVITIVQESRFQMADDDGVSHLFMLSPFAAAEPAQLPPLRGRRVRVRFREGRNVIGNVASAIIRLG